MTTSDSLTTTTPTMMMMSSEKNNSNNEMIVEKRIKKLKIKNLTLLKLQITQDDQKRRQEEGDDRIMSMEFTNSQQQDAPASVVPINNGDSEDEAVSTVVVAAAEESEDDEEVESEEEEEEEEDTNGDNIIDDLDLNQDDSLSHKTFKERAIELMRKTQGEHSHLVHRSLSSDDWLFIHRIIRKSKGLKSKFMMRNLSPFLFEGEHVMGWKCKFCKELISAPCTNYISHLTEVHGVGSDEDPLFPCDVCGTYVKKDKYVVHWVPHFMEHECPICKKTFALNCHMKYHYKVVHEVQEVTCYQCGKLMKNDLAMRRHLRLFHSNRTNWKICDICGKCVKSRCLEPHKLTHSQDRPYKCEVPLCKKCFKTPSTLYQHQKVHATDSKAHKYLCEYCGKRFKHHTSWNLHVVRIHEGEYEHECPICKKKFHKLFELKKHSVKHSEDRPFPCSVCQKHFKTKTHLKEHITIHSAEKSHICPLCGKGIRMKANLYKHLKVHRNRGEYVPPLNGNSSNALLNNYGFSSSINCISSCNNNSSTSQYTTNNNNNNSNNNDNSFMSDNDKNIQQQQQQQQQQSQTNFIGDEDVAMELSDNLTSSTEIDLNLTGLSEDDKNLCVVTAAATNLVKQEQFQQQQQHQSVTNEIVDDCELIMNTVQQDNQSEPQEQEQQHHHPHQLIVLDSNNAILSVHDNMELNLRKHLQKYDGLFINGDGTILGQSHPPLPSHNDLMNGVGVSVGVDGVEMGTNNDFDDGGTVTADNNLAMNNIISLIAHTQNEALRIGGPSVTHVTIMVNHNLGVSSATLAQTQSD